MEGWRAKDRREETCRDSEAVLHCKFVHRALHPPLPPVRIGAGAPAQLQPWQLLFRLGRGAGCRGGGKGRWPCMPWVPLLASASRLKLAAGFRRCLGLGAHAQALTSKRSRGSAAGGEGRTSRAAGLHCGPPERLAGALTGSWLQLGCRPAAAWARSVPGLPPCRSSRGCQVGGCKAGG